MTNAKTKKVRNRAYADLIRSRRSNTIDPLTHEPYSQARIGELIGRSKAYIGILERGGIESPPPSVVNPLSRIIPVSVEEQLKAMGYDLPDVFPIEMTDEEREVVETLRRLPAPQKRALLATARALLGTQPPPKL